MAASIQHHDRNCCEIRSIYVKDRDLIVLVIRFLVLMEACERCSEKNVSAVISFAVGIVINAVI